MKTGISYPLRAPGFTPCFFPVFFCWGPLCSPFSFLCWVVLFVFVLCLVLYVTSVSRFSHLGSSTVFCVEVRCVHLLVFCVVLFCLSSFCVLCSMLPVSLDFPTLVHPLFFVLRSVVFNFLVFGVVLFCFSSFCVLCYMLSVSLDLTFFIAFQFSLMFISIIIETKMFWGVWGFETCSFSWKLKCNTIKTNLDGLHWPLRFHILRVRCFIYLFIKVENYKPYLRNTIWWNLVKLI